MKKKVTDFGKKNILLSLVALILVTMLAVSVSYSWIDDLTDVKIDTSNIGTNTPLTVGHDIHADFTLSDAANAENTEINIGRILANDGKTVTDGGYFYESGGMHLSPCYGNGVTFKIPKNGNLADCRDATNDDYNVSFISATINITAPKYKTVFWFKELPTFTYKKYNSQSTVYDSNEEYQYMRFSVSIDGKTDVYGYTDSYSVSNTETKNDGRLFSKYTFGDSANSDNANTLFSINKGETKTVNFKIWCEAGINNRVCLSDLNLSLISSYAKTRTITIDNKTTGTGKDTWMTDNSAKVYLAIPAARENGEWEEDESYWDISTSIHNSAHADVTIPYGYYDEEMLIFRCSPNTPFGTTDETQIAGGEEQRSTYKIYCWNFWQTILPNTFKNETYTMYGATYDKDSVAWVYDVNAGDSDPNNDSPAYKNEYNKGYGTWSGVTKIQFDSNDKTISGNNATFNPAYYMTPNSCNVFIEDYSDYATNGHVYYYTMAPDKDNQTTGSNGKTIWTGYIPTTSNQITFHYLNRNNANTDYYWGYSVQKENDGGYTSSYLLKDDSTDDNKKGYKRGSNNYFGVYIVPSGSDTYGRGKWKVVLQSNASASKRTVKPKKTATEPATEKADETDKSDFLTAAQAKAYAEANGAADFLEINLDGSDNVYLPFSGEKNTLSTELKEGSYNIAVCSIDSSGELVRLLVAEEDEEYTLDDALSISFSKEGVPAKLNVKSAGGYSFEYDKDNDNQLTVKK